MSRAMQLKARINNLAEKNNIPAQAVLQNYMLERLLERIALSRYKDRFVLKGGLLIASMVGIASRTTMDMDTTLQGYPLLEHMQHKVWSEICSITLDDQISLSIERILPIHEDVQYGGYRVAIMAQFESIRTPLKIDITSGDVITPAAIRYSFQSSFEDKEIEIWAYNIETILAEKVETILRRSVLNTRPRDYYDVYILAKNCRVDIHLDTFRAALNATVENRGSQAALEDRERILHEIQADPTMLERWDRYRRDNYYARDIEFGIVMSVFAEIFDELSPGFRRNQEQQ
jgi:predicted nucleotidyltransferase component of viral defense system